MRRLASWTISLAPTALLALVFMFLMHMWLGSHRPAEAVLGIISLAFAHLLHALTGLMLWLSRLCWFFTFAGIFHERHRRLGHEAPSYSGLLRLLPVLVHPGNPTETDTSLWHRALWWRATLLLAILLSALYLAFGPLLGDAPPVLAALPEQVTYTLPQAVVSNTVPAQPGAQGTTTALGMYSRNVAVGGFQVPLPPGEWVLLANLTTRNPSATVQSYFLGQIAHQRLMGAIRIATIRPTEKSVQGFQAVNCPKLNPTLYFLDTDPGSTPDHKSCWMMGHIFTLPMQRWTDPGVPMNGLERAAAKELAARGITYAQDYVNVQFIKGARSGLLQAGYWFNPEAEGIASHDASSLFESDWQTGKLEQFADKHAYVDNLKHWGDVFRERVDRAFDAGQ